MRLQIFSVPLMGLLLLPSVALPWGGLGHRTIGEIAERHLSPKAAEQVAKILDGEQLSDVAVWADEIRSERRETSPFHYINFEPGNLSPSPEYYEIEKGNVYMAVVGYSAILTNPNAPAQDRAEALKYVVHFIGDLHQPLHCGYEHDRGGNTVEGMFFADATNLHRMWDSQILEHRYRGTDYPALTATLLAAFPEEERAAWENEREIKVWMRESAELLTVDFYPTLGADGRFTLGEEYQARHIGTVEKRLVQGGLRLAATLNTLLGEEPQFPFEPLKTPLPIGNAEFAVIVPPLFPSSDDAATTTSEVGTLP